MKEHQNYDNSSDIGYMIKVSVVMPVYNVEEYLEEALLSVMNQTLREIEIICVNDGSTDGSLNILKKCADMDERIRIISKENSGYGHTMNVGIEAAQGEYIGVVETDDYIDSTMMEELYKEAATNQLDMVKAGYREFMVNEARDRVFKNVPILAQKDADLYGEILNAQSDLRVFDADLVTWAGIYKCDFLNKYSIRHNETPGASYQDNGFWFQVMMHAQRLSFMDKLFYNLRRDNPNSSIYSKGKVFCMCEEYDFIREKITESNHPMKKELLGICFAKRISNYKWTLNRIAPEYRQDFYVRMRQDYEEALERGEIRSDFLSRSDWNYVYTVLHSESLIFMDASTMKDFARERILKAEKIYIYGAGSWGANVYRKLQGCMCAEKVKGFLVTSKENEKESMFDIPIMELEHAELAEDYLVIAAVADKYLAEVLTAFEAKGHKNYVLKNDLF